MFVCVARVGLEVPAAQSPKMKRQVVRRITDRVKAKFNVAVAELEDDELSKRATVALSVVGTERRHVQVQMDKVVQFIEDMYVAPVTSRELEVLAFGDQLFGPNGEMSMDKGERSLAEAEGMGAWEERERTPHVHSSPSAPTRASSPRPSAALPTGPNISIEEARARARALRNKREWE